MRQNGGPGQVESPEQQCSGSVGREDQANCGGVRNELAASVDDFALGGRGADRVIAAAGCLLVGVALVLAVAGLGEDAAYATQMLPVSLIDGVGVGLALPTILASATADLPPARASTGSAVVNMSRQVSSVLGVHPGRAARDAGRLRRGQPGP